MRLNDIDFKVENKPMRGRVVGTKTGVEKVKCPYYRKPGQTTACDFSAVLVLDEW